MRKLFCSLFILFVCNIEIVFSSEIYQTIYRQDRAPIIIDGDLSDWEELTSKLEKIEYINEDVYKKYEFKRPGNEEDLSATFQCFADQFYLYVSVVVKDCGSKERK